MKCKMLKIKMSLLTGILLTTAIATAQPQGFSYQAVVRDSNGELVKNQNVGIQLTLADSTGTKTMYRETQTATTNSYGVLSVTVGNGIPDNNTSLSGVDWASGKVWLHISIDVKGGVDYTNMGATKIQAVPVALYAASSGNGVQNNNTTATSDNTLFEVKDKDGNVVFAVYPNGVHVYIDTADHNDKARRSGFLVTGRTATKGETADLLAVDVDGTHVYIDPDSEAKARRSGFLVTGRTATKDGIMPNYLTVDDEGTKVFVDDELESDAKARRSGFIVTGRTATKDDATNYLKVATDGTQVRFDSDDSKARRSGFIVTGRTATKNGEESDMLEVTADSTRIYVDGNGKNGFGINNRDAENNIGYMNVTPENFFAGYDAGRANKGRNNTFIGNNAGKNDTIGEDNVYIGTSAGINGSGSENVYIGTTAGINGSGSENIFIGCNSGPSCSGTRNVFLGWHSGRLATTAKSNVIIGDAAGDRNKTGNENVFLGSSAGYNNDGNQNVFIGNSTFRMHTTGDHNIAIGDGTGDRNDGSEYCIVIGYQAGWNSGNGGNNNVIIGTKAGYKFEGDNNVFIGNNAGFNETGSNRLYIANSPFNPLIYGEFDNKIVTINGAQVSTSDQRFKENIKTLNGSLQKINSIRGVSFTWKTNDEISKIKGIQTDSVDNSRLQEGTQLGVIAQEVEKVLPELVYTDDKGFKSVDYIKLTPVLIEAIKEQQKEIEELKATNSKLQSQIEEILKKLDK